MTWNSCSDSEESVLGAVTCYPGKYLRQKIFASDWQERSVISYWIWCWNPLICVGMNQTSWLKKTWIKETQHHEEQGDIIETRNETSIQTREEALDMIKAQQHSTNIIHNLPNLASAGIEWDRIVCWALTEAGNYDWLYPITDYSPPRIWFLLTMSSVQETLII